MTDWQAVFAPVRDELDLWQQEGLRAQLWFRDDDAVEPTGQLDRLISITGAHDVPLLLCVVPQPTSKALREALAEQEHVCVAVHGFGHQNHAPAGEKAEELGPHRPARIVAGELAEARAKLLDLYGERLSSILVPPWNRIAPDVVSLLPELGFAGISTFGTAHEAGGVAGLAQLNTHLDIIDWKGTRGGRDPEWLANELARLLKLSRNGDAGPIGVLAHHLVHDEPAWQFLGQLFELTGSHPGARWCTADALIETT